MSSDGDPRAGLPTERSNPRSEGFDRMSTAEALELFDTEDRYCVEAVRAARDSIGAAIELVVEALGAGGRLIYVGAGTSGRLGLLDAVECPPTFHSPPDRVQGRMAGGPQAFARSIEGAEDSSDEGAATVADVGPRDVVCGIAAGGTTPFVHGALRAARERGASTIFVACVPKAEAPDEADLSIRLDTGPEILSGSTRLKAGTATKLVLNRMTTIAFARLGKVHGNLMVDVDTRGNTKLRARGAELLRRIRGVSFDAAEDLLDRSGGRVKLAALMHAHGVDRARAERHLESCGGFLRRALEEEPG